MRALAVNNRLRDHVVDIDRHDGVNGVNQRYSIRPALKRSFGRPQNVGDVRGQFGKDRNIDRVLDPTGDLFDHFRHLTDGRPHAAFAHAVRAPKVKLQTMHTAFGDLLGQVLPGAFLDRGHHRSDDDVIRILFPAFADFLKVGGKRTVGNQLDIVDPQQTAVLVMVRAIARGHVDHGRIDAQRLPDNPAPACFKGANNVVFLVRWRRGGQPERV